MVKVNSQLIQISALLVTLICPAVVFAQAGANDGEWRVYGGDAGSTRYSPLDQINSDNVSELELAWRWRTDNFGPTPESNFRVTPIMVGRTLYTSAGYRRAAVAVDASTGETLWMYRMDEGIRGERAPRVNSGRGVAYWSDGVDERIVLITPGYHMVALDANTGLPVQGFGTAGVVDLKEGLDRFVDLVEGRIGSSSPPIIVNDVIVVGAALPQGTAPPTKEMPPGHVRGYDVRTGQQLWIFHTIPQPGDFGHDTWEDESWSYTGNAAVWTSLTADEDLGYVYLPVEAGTGDYYGGHRLGDNLFSQSLVCLDARTGERVWHFQMVHHGIWDYDPPAAPVLVDITVGGRQIQAVAQVTKQGFTFVLDRVTGDPVWPIEERAVPQTDIPGERTSPTQPFPTKPAPFDRQGFSLDDLIDFTPALREEAVRMTSSLRMGPIYTPPSVMAEDGSGGTISLPGSLGGANWPGAAVDPESGILYVGSSTQPSVLGLVNDPERSNMRYVRTGSAVMESGGPQGLPLVKPPWGRITAIDLNTGDQVWMAPNGEAPEYVRDHPALVGIDIGRTGRADRSGLLVTKTLLFAGEGGGMIAARGAGGNILRAHDKLTGEIVAEVELPANQTGVPMTYMVDGKQYIVVAVGSRGRAAELVALTVSGER